MGGSPERKHQSVRRTCQEKGDEGDMWAETGREIVGGAVCWKGLWRLLRRDALEREKRSREWLYCLPNFSSAHSPLLQYPSIHAPAIEAEQSLALKGHWHFKVQNIWILTISMLGKFWMRVNIKKERKKTSVT